MGVAQRGSIAAALMAGGLSPDTPVAAVRHATGEEQSVLSAARWPRWRDSPVRSPATIVVGPVAALDVVHGLTAPLANRQ